MFQEDETPGWQARKSVALILLVQRKIRTPVTGSSSGRSVATDGMRKVTADDGEIMSIKNKKVTRCDATAW